MFVFRYIYNTCDDDNNNKQHARCDDHEQQVDDEQHRRFFFFFFLIAPLLCGQCMSEGMGPKQHASCHLDLGMLLF